jgi:hypothetical protein
LINQLQRRDFITLLGGTAAAWPVGVRAQQPTMALVGLLAGQQPTLRPRRRCLEDAAGIRDPSITAQQPILFINEARHE